MDKSCTHGICEVLAECGGEVTLLPGAKDVRAEESQLSARETHSEHPLLEPNVACVQWENVELETLQDIREQQPIKTKAFRLQRRFLKHFGQLGFN